MNVGRVRAGPKSMQQPIVECTPVRAKQRRPSICGATAWLPEC